MAIHIDKMTVEDLVNALHDEKVNINDLSLKKSVQREAFLQVLEKRPALLRKVNEENAKSFLKYAIEKNYELFVYLRPQQYTNTLAQIFLYNRLANPKKDGRKDKKQADVAKEGLSFILNKSLDDSVVFNCSYTTPEGEELFFFDSDLKVPVGLRSSYKLALKITDAVALINKLDTHITHLGKNRVENYIEDIVGNLYKSHLNSFIEEHKVGFYALTTSYSEIESSFIPKLNRALSDAGLSVSSFVIKAIAIPRDIQYKIEDQAFEIRRRMADAEADSQISKKSLEDYEAKLAIQHKYPDAPATLTEYEKDLALRRYMLRTGLTKATKIDHNIEIAKANEKADDKISKELDIVPELPPSNFKRNFFIWLTICAIFSLLMLVSAGGFGLICLIATALIFSIVGYTNRDKFSSKPEIAPKSTDEDISE